jgi:hypothetical protein
VVVVPSRLLVCVVVIYFIVVVIAVAVLSVGNEVVDWTLRELEALFPHAHKR